MKKIILLFYLFFISNAVVAQNTLNDTAVFMGKIKNDFTYLRSDIGNARIVGEPLNSGEILFAYSYEKSQYSGGYYGVFKDTLQAYIKEGDLFLLPEIKDYLEKNEGFNEIRYDRAKKNSELYYLHKLDEKIKQYESYKKTGLVITSKEYSYGEYGSSFGLKLSFYNGHKKAIKYIEVTVRPYNRVGDKTYDDIGKDVARVKVIGPLDSDHTASVEFDDMFWDDRDVISYLVITYMKVTFMDGTTTEIKDIKKHLAKEIYNGRGE